MKILFVHNRYQYKGGEDNVLEMELTLLKNKGHQTRVLLFDNDSISSFSSKIKTALSSLYNFASARRLKKEIKYFQPDVIHIHNLFFKASPSILYAARQMKVPVVLTLHNFRTVCANAILLRDGHVCELCVHKTFPIQGIKYKCYRDSAIESALVTGITGMHKLLHTWQNKIDQIIVLSHFMENKFKDSSLKIPTDKFNTLPNFIEDPGDNDSIREEVFLFVGRLSKEKGLSLVLDCFEHLPHLKLIVAGDGPEKDKVIASSERSPNISYIGHQSKEQVMHQMKKCTAIIFPSIWFEGLPLSIIEALSVGTPVIGSKLGAMEEMIEDGYNGLHFQAGNINSLKEKLTLYADLQPLEKNTFQANARISYLNKYQPEIHYRELIRIYQKANKKALNINTHV